MGHDGSLFITLGEGSHFDTDVMDFGQNQTRYPYSGYCGVFFPGQGELRRNLDENSDYVQLWARSRRRAKTHSEVN